MDRGQWANLAKGHHGFFYDQRVSGPKFNNSSKGQCFLAV